MDRVRHKQSNRFKFQSFAERISNINIDVFHRIPHKYEDDGEESYTYFYQAVQKWSTLNLTENFKTFRHEMGNEISTLPQLLNHKNKIVSVFLKHIKSQNVPSLEPILDILVAFVKDIRYEFYEFYPEILKELINLLKLKLPEILECVFTCLAYIFKYLARELVKDLDKVLLDLAPLLNDENPAYVQDFAAQSFAFVARKVKDKEKFLLLILQTIQSSPELLNGSSQLVFHMLCGIRGQSHSCAEGLLSTLFNQFGNNSLPQKLLFLLANNIVTSYGSVIKPPNSVFFPVLLGVVKEKMENESDSSKSIKYLLKIMRVGLLCRSGANLQDSCIPEITSCVTKLLSSSDNKIRSISSDICSDLLTLEKVKIPQELTSLIVIKVLDTEDEEILLKFMNQTINFSGFETLVIPQALEKLCSSGSKTFLRNLSEIIVNKIEPQTNNYNILHKPVYNILARNSVVTLKNIVLEIIEKFDPNSSTGDEILYALIIIRHISPVDETKVSQILLETIKKLRNCIDSDNKAKDNYLFIMCTAFESLYFFKDSVHCVSDEDISLLTSVLKLLGENNTVIVLRTVNLLLTIFEDIKLSDDLLVETCESLEKMLQSPHSHVRFLSLHSLQSLEKLKGKQKSGKDMVGILDLCLNAEVIPLTIADYREKINQLQKLKYESLPNLSDDNYKVIIKYLLGVLYCNFQLLWDSVCDILATYACGVPKIFWDIFYQQLCSVTRICKDRTFLEESCFPVLDDFLLHNVRFIKIEDKADYKNYRYLMWKSMTLFVDLCEARNRDVVSMYLSFLNEELLKSSSEHKLTVSIMQNEVGENEEENIESSNAKNMDSKSNSSFIIKWAVAHLTLLSKFKSPKVCYKESEVRKSYYDLLEHKNLEIQKLALECLLTYKFKYMVPYKQNLRNLIEEAKFRDEIIHFQIDKENGVVKENDREELMPVVMRILYNKMMSKGAIKRGSKGSAAVLKRSTVFRFLAGCSESEMAMFLSMAFRTFHSYQQANSDEFVKIKDSVNLKDITPPKKLLSVLNLVDVIIEHFGGLMTVNIQRYILKIIFSVGAITSGIFAQREKVFSGYMTQIKNLKTAVTDCLAKFFDRLYFPWSEDEINTVFEIFVWNTLAKLPVEGLYNPTAILRLFSIWSENPRYHKLFARFKADDKSISPLPFIMTLLIGEKTQNTVTSFIIAIIEKLLTLKEEITEENILETPLEIGNLHPIYEDKIKGLSLKEELNYGSQILFPHVGSILIYLRRKLEKSNSPLQKVELTVLSRVTELATSPENADSLMTVLLRLLISSKKLADDETLMDMLTTIENLSKVVNKPLSYLRSFAILLNCLESLETRRALVNTLLNVQLRCPEINDCINLIKDLNANDLKWVDQPDFDKRLDAYKQAHTLAREGKMDLNCALMVLYNCFYVIRCDPDLSLRESASHCLREICPILANHWKENKNQNQFWIDSILKLIHTAMIGKNENFQCFAISLLGVMARECRDLHQVLKDLSVYANKADLEVDLFENSIHLQSHRRVRALLRFCSLSKTLDKAPNSRTLVQFILPLATKYLCNEKYLGKNALIDAAISCLGAVSRFLPWQKYQTVLRYYLSKFKGKVIEYQRQLVRIVIAILDSFHFDISKASEITIPMVSEDKRKENTVNVNSTKKSSLDDELEEEEEEEEEEEKEKEKENENENENENEKEKEEEEEKEKEKENEKEDEDEDEDRKSSQKEEEEEEEENELLDKLHEVDKNESEEETDEKEKKNVGGKAYQSIVVLSPAEAYRVEKTMSGSLLSQLTKAIGQRSQKENTHKTNIKSLGPDRDQEEVMRIPIAVTLVKLLQKVSKKMLDDHLSGIFMKLCTFLKSKMESVRRATRETLQQIMVSLGPKYLNVILSEITSALTKGFQLHVLIFTVHSVIQAIEKQLKPGDIDQNLDVLLEICKTDIFGQPGEEKDVKKILVKHKEVRSTKSYRLMNIIAQYVTENCLTNILLPIKDVLTVSTSHKVITKCRECLRHIVSGLCCNEFVSSENLFIYSYGVTSESIPTLSGPEPLQEKKKNPREKRDCFIIPEEPKSRTGVFSNPVKKDPKSNSHILLEFGFQLLQFILKKDKLKLTPNFKSLLDPHGPILVKAVQSQHVKVSTLALNCLCKMFKFDLPSIRKEVKKLIHELFAILHKYAAPGLCKGETFDLVLVTFKTICVIMRDTNCEEINCDQLKILLVYVEQDIYDNNRQASAFNLLKTILKKKLKVPELNDLMKKVAELSISSELAHVRLQARQSTLQYIMDYPLGKDLEYFIGFYISQLSFEVESGRQSAMEMIHSFITNFPEEVLNDECGLFLITLGARLVNDDSPECKKAVSSIVKSMLMRLNENHRTQLFDIICLWLKQNKISHKRLAAQMAGIFVTMEKADFAKRLPSFLPLIKDQFLGEKKPGKFVRLPKKESGREQEEDHHLFQVLQLLLKMCTHCPKFLSDPKHRESVDFFAETCQSLMCHPHEWVRLAAVQFLGSVFNSVDPAQVSRALQGEVKDGLEFLTGNCISQRIKGLILDHVSQFIPGVDIGEELIDQVTKNLVYFARVLKDIKETKIDSLTNGKSEKEEEAKEEGEEDEQESAKSVSILWLIRKMRYVVNKEIVEAPLSYTLRTGVLKWIGAVAVCFTKEELTKVLYHLIAPVVRERDLLEGEHARSPIKSLVDEVTKVLKVKVGTEEFTREAVKIRKRLIGKRTERRAQRAQEFVTNPERAAKRKIEKQAKKKLLKKRKIEAYKGKGIKRFPRKRKAEEDLFV